MRSGLLPQTGDFTASLLLGRGQFPAVYSAPDSNAGSISSPSSSTFITSANANSLVNMIGVEGRYFATDNIAIKLSAGFLTANTPGRQQIEGVFGEVSNVPTIESVEANVTTQLRVEFGGEYHFDVKSQRLSPYVGLAVPFYYSKDNEYDPGFDYSTTSTTTVANTSGGTTTTTSTTGSVDDVNGVRRSILVGISTQAVAGVDYHFNKDIYFGVQVNAVGYEYAFLQQSSGEGLPVAKASTYGFNFFTTPVVKLGFKF